MELGGTRRDAGSRTRPVARPCAPRSANSVDSILGSIFNCLIFNLSLPAANAVIVSADSGVSLASTLLLIFGELFFLVYVDREVQARLKRA